MSLILIEIGPTISLISWSILDTPVDLLVRRADRSGARTEIGVLCHDAVHLLKAVLGSVPIM